MATVAPKPAHELNLALQKPVNNEPSNVAREAERRLDAFVAAHRNEVMPDQLLVRLDADSQRFVQTLTDPTTAETVRRYPSESQLAYSRAVMAYLRALNP
jgi:hypothetical protein